MKKIVSILSLLSTLAYGMDIDPLEITITIPVTRTKLIEACINDSSILKEYLEDNPPAPGECFNFWIEAEFKSMKKKGLFLSKVLERLPEEQAIAQFPAALNRTQNFLKLSEKFSANFPQHSNAPRIKEAAYFLKKGYQALPRKIRNNPRNKFELERLGLSGLGIFDSPEADKATRSLFILMGKPSKQDEEKAVSDIQKHCNTLRTVLSRYPHLHGKHTSFLRETLEAHQACIQPHIKN